MATLDFTRYLEQYLGKRVRFDYQYSGTDVIRTVEGVIAQVCIPAPDHKDWVGFSFLLRQGLDESELGEYYEFDRYELQILN